MKKRLKAELRKIAAEIVTTRDLGNIDSLYDASKELYEKLAVLRYIQDSLEEAEVDVSRNTIATKFENMANSVLHANASVPESNPHKEDIMVPGIETIKDMVSEMPHPTTIDEVLSQFTSKPDLLRQEEDLFTPKKVVLAAKLHNTTRSVQGHREIKVDLNDKLAFVKHLFHNSMEDYNRVLSQLSTIDTEERSIAFIVNMIKPDYENWIGKEEYEARFMAVITKKFMH